MGTDLRGVRLERAATMVSELLAAGVSKDEIALVCGASWWTIFRWARGERAPHPTNFARLIELHARHVCGAG